MEPRYVLILVFCVGGLNIIKLTDEDFESFLSTIKERYGFRLNSCQWMTTENLDIYCYQNGEKAELNLL